MKKVTCISYHSTGSSAVDDYLREFKGMVLAPSDAECRFMQDPDGISDLEYNLVDNWHRLNSGFAIKRFEKFAKYYNHTYSLIFGRKWKKCVKEYTSNLVDFSYRGYWHADIRLLSRSKQLVYYFKRFTNKLLPRKARKTTDYNYFPKLMSYNTHITREKFYEETQQFCENLCESITKKGTEMIVLDQCVSTTNISRYLNYIKDLKVIIVDRDPRDVYIEETERKYHYLPTDIKQFAMQFREARLSAADECKNPNVLKIQFEDMVYKYDETTKKINEFLGLKSENHIYKKKYFDPDISAGNTKKWEENKSYEKETEYLEHELKEYLYSF